MVHALREILRVLRLGGSLIDLRPAAKHRQVELELASARLNVGEIDSSATFADHVAADAALEVVLGEGHLRKEHQETFLYISDLDSVADLRRFAATLRRSILPQAVLNRIEGITVSETEDYRIRIRREISISRFRRTNTPD